jgi:hypothetical protein
MAAFPDATPECGRAASDQLLPPVLVTPKARLPGAEVTMSTRNTPEVRRVEDGASTPRW